MNNQDNITPSETSNPIVIDAEQRNLAEVQDKDFQTAIMNLFEDLKEDMNK